MMNYKDSSVLITGASRGIGRVLSIQFSRDTDRPLILLARSKQKLEKTRTLCEEAGATRVVVISCDATDEKEVQGIVLPDGFPPPGIIINNAGGYLYKKLQETTSGEFMEQIQLNLFAAIHITNRFLPGLKQVDRGLIVNICSVASLSGYGESGAYAASKHAVLGYTRSLRKELMRTRVAVTAVNLGQTYSSSWEGSDVDPGVLVNPEDLGKLLVTFTRLSPNSVVEEIILRPHGGGV